VGVSFDGGISWVAADVEERVGFGWQGFRATLDLAVGRHEIIARATLRDGSVQPLSGTRNHCHRVEFEVVG
jgi:sulfite dehydrogenase